MGPGSDALPAVALAKVGNDGMIGRKAENGSWKLELRNDLATLYGDSFEFSEIENGQFITETGPFDRGFILVEILNVQFCNVHLPTHL